MPRTQHRAHTDSTRIDLAPDKREAIIAMLNQSLADVFDLFSQTKQAHWNVKGNDFYQLHLLFDEIAAELVAFADEIAERAIALGGYATGTTRMAAHASTLPEFPSHVTHGLGCVEALAERFAHLARDTRQAIDQADDLGDLGTADLYTQISRALDKRLWFLEAHLQNGD